MKKLVLYGILAAAGALVLSATAHAAATKVYWTDSNNGDSPTAIGIWRSNVDGSLRQPVSTSQYGPWAIDTAGLRRKIYWARNDLYRSNLDGSNEQLLTDVPFNAMGVAVDEGDGKVYWVDAGAPSFGIPGTLSRANLDGTDVETILSGFAAGIANPREVAVDPVGGQVYWTEVGFGVRRINVDGTGLETIAPSLGFTSAIAIDVVGRKVYWSDNGTILRANLDGSGRQAILSSYALGLAVDSDSGKLYFTDLVTKSVQRTNLDGSGLEVVATGGLDTPWSVALLSLVLDTVPPETRIVGGPQQGSVTNETSAWISFEGEDNVTPASQLTFSCFLDGTEISDCESPRYLPGLSEGGHAFEVQAIDEDGNADPTPARVEWTVDTTLPELDLAVTPGLLGPPNHRLVAVALNPAARDANGIESMWLSEVTSSEPDDGLGDGDQPGDIQDADIGALDRSIFLRAERAGSGNGRVYTVTMGARDMAGNVTFVSRTIVVPHSPGN